MKEEADAVLVGAMEPLAAAMLSPDAQDASAHRVGRGIASIERQAPASRTAARPRVGRLLSFDALVASLAAEAGILVGPHGHQPRLLLLAGVPAVMLPAWLLGLALAGEYDRLSLTGSAASRRVVGVVVALLAALGVSPVVGLSEPLRSSLAAALPLAGLLTLAARWTAAVRSRAAVGAVAPLRVVLAGAGPRVESLAAAIRRGRTHDVEVVGVAHPDDAAEIAREAGADLLVVAAAGGHAGTDLRRLAWQLEGTGCGVAAALPATDVAAHRLAVRMLGGAPVVTVREPVLDGVLRGLKDVSERATALVLGLLLSPLIVCIAVAVRLSGNGPILFRQTRLGRHGRPFTILKFRTMVAGAEQIDVLHLNEHAGPHFKVREDPRITPIGRRLRRSSLDELPQLWNVLTGSMSLIGPRPPLPREVAAYDPDMRRRLLVKPGMTGLWQVSGRADLPWEETVRLDLFYVDNWSLILDAEIAARTLSAVVLGRGAY